MRTIKILCSQSQTDRQTDRPVQRMRNILAILALFVFTSICLGREVSIPESPDDKYHNYAANVDAVLVKGWFDDTGDNDWIAPVGCILNIDRDDSRIGDYACGARMRGMDAGGVYWYADVEGGRRMTGNKVNVDTGFFNNSIIAGAYSEDISGAVDNNAVTITATQGGNIQNVYGGRAYDTSASSNTVTITGGRIGGSGKMEGAVYGGYIHLKGTATLNTVNLTSITVSSNVYGARIGRDGYENMFMFHEATGDGLVSSNTVTIKGGKIEGDVYGGRTSSGTVSSNTVTITSGAVKNVFGGYIINNGTAILNKVDLTSVTVSSNVYGAWIGGNGLAEDNKVRIDGNEKIEGEVYGGYIEGKGTATLNEVDLTSVTVSSNVYGAWIGNGLAEDNKVRIDGKGNRNIRGAVYGGYIQQEGTATLNAVDLTNVTVSNDVCGARIGNRYREVTGGGLASSNTVTIKGGKIEKGVYGGRTYKGTVSSNTVIISSNVTIVEDVIGGCIDENGTATLNTVNLTDVIVKQCVFGAWIEKNGYASSNTVTIKGGKITGNVYGGYIQQEGTATLNAVDLTNVTVSNDVCGAWIENGLARDNRVTIEGGKIEGEVCGGYVKNGTATINKVNLTSVTVTKDIFGGKIEIDVLGMGRFENGLASSNTVTITSGIVKNIYGGYIAEKGTATWNKVNLTSVTVMQDVYGANIGSGLASSNTVTITSGIVDSNVYGGCIVGKGTATGNTVNLTSVTVSSNVYGARIGCKYGNRSGLASSNTVTINGGKIEGNVFGGFVKGNGKAIYNTITITGVTEFSTATILCGGICANKATADTFTNDAFTGNTLNIVETKGVVVKGISNFENYKFHLKDIKPGEVILTATSGGCSWDVGEYKYTPACKVDLSRSNIHLRTQSVINKDEYCTLIKSPQGFKDNISCKQFSFDNGGLVEYSWEIKIVDNGQDLIATLKRKELKEEKAKPLLEGNVTGMVCINNGMDCIISKMEETESVLGEGAKLQRKGEIGAFYGLLANKSSYDDTGSHIDMTGMSMMGGIGIRWKGLVTGAFGEYGTGNSDIDSVLCPCEKKSEGKSNYVGGGLLGRYNVCENEFSGTKLYLEAILRAGEVSNTFNSKEAKDGAEKECKYNDETTMYGGCALGGGYKHKVGEKMDVDWSLRYMFGYQDGKDVEKPVDVYGNRVKLESVRSSRIRVGVRGKYVELEKVKPYIGIWYEHELSGEVKGAIQNGVDNVGDIPATSFEGGTGIGELGVSVKVGKLDVGISGQGYLGVRKGFGGMLKLKYAFGKDAHAKPPFGFQNDNNEEKEIAESKEEQGNK